MNYKSIKLIYSILNLKLSFFIFILYIFIEFRYIQADPFPISETQQQEINQKYGQEAMERIRSWKKLMVLQEKDNQDEELLNIVNDFFNQIIYQSDVDTWGVEDYWATPIEFLSRNHGDCEDYSIAKYFTLIEMGVSEDKLRIMYVKAVELNQSHMVLTYAEEPGVIPLVLDNINPKILRASRRKDLNPIYSFNGSGLWMAKERNQGKSTHENKLSRWSDLISRLEK